MPTTPDKWNAESERYEGHDYEESGNLEFCMMGDTPPMTIDDPILNPLED